MKKLLVPLLGDAQDDVALYGASALAATHGANIEAHLFLRDPIDVVPFVGEGVSADVIDKILESAKETAKVISAASKTRFKQWCEKENISDSGGAIEGAMSATLDENVGNIPASLIPFARAADMAVFACKSDDWNVDREPMLRAAIFESGRPVLLVPNETVPSIGKKIVVTWNGSAEAARAVAVAMPTLMAAEAVIVLTVRDHNEAEPESVANTLRLNGINASANIVSEAAGGVSETLIDEARKIEADLLVIGAYSHNRLREFVLGGVTMDYIDGTRIPVLMMH